MDPNDWTLTGNTGSDPATNFLGTTDNEPLVIRTNGVEHLRITPDGNVGIGTATPGSKLDVVQANSAAIRALSGAENSNTSLSIGRTADEGRIGVAANVGQFAKDAFVGDIILRTEPTTDPFGIPPRLLFGNGTGNSAMAISNGNVGIGTTGPQTKLEVNGQIYINNLITTSGDLITTSVNQLSITTVSFPPLHFNWGHFYRDLSSTNRLYFGASDSLTTVPPSPIMTWDLVTGNVGIGTANAGSRLEVNGNFSVSGDVTVSGDVILTGPGADCAEEFDVAETVDIEPGTVMVLDQDGALHQSQKAYDKRVAGVISGAGDYRPGLILDRRQSQDNRLPVALVGKVYCKVDAQYAPIEVGDLLTTSPTQGHAMRADDPFKAFGSVIGKALRPLKAGREMIPILIALQ
jgi:hypothetical protein